MREAELGVMAEQIGGVVRAVPTKVDGQGSTIVVTLLIVRGSYLTVSSYAVACRSESKAT